MRISAFWALPYATIKREGWCNCQYAPIQLAHDLTFLESTGSVPTHFISEIRHSFPAQVFNFLCSPVCTLDLGVCLLHCCMDMALLLHVLQKGFSIKSGCLGWA